MTTCAFRYCKNTSRNVTESSGISFHRFVHPDHPKREEWIKIVQKDRSEDTWLPSRYSFICSAHFQADDIYMTKYGKRFLKKSAVPCSNLSENVEKYPQDSPTSLDEMEISDSESIFDTPRKIKLKQDLRKVSAEKKAMSKKVTKLQQQNKYLRKKTETLNAIVKQLKEKLLFNRRRLQNLLANRNTVTSASENI